MSVGYTSDSVDWNRALDGARTKEQLVAAIEQWQPFVDDALAVAKAMDDKAFLVWRSGLSKERKGAFAGMKWADRFMAILIPDKFLRAGIVADQYKVPLGLALWRLAEVDKTP
jgi:hypothetical protein